MGVIQLDTKKYEKIIEESKNNIYSEFPRIIEFQTSSYCNGNCIVCPYSSMDIKPVKMNDDTLKNLLKEIVSNKDKIERVIPYLNNEPSFDKRMINILRYLKNNQLLIELSTNMSMWTKEELDIIIDEKLVDDFRISFFADNRELYHIMMPGLNFDSNVERINYFLNKNKNIIDTEIVAIMLPHLNVKKIRDGLKELFNNPQIHLFGFLDRCGKVKGFKNDLEINEDSKLIGCSLKRPFERCCIYADGNVVLCSQDWAKKVVIGNINDNSISEIWNSERAIKIRKIVSGEISCEKDFLCNSCKLAILEESSKKVLNFKGDRYMKNDDTKRI